MSEHNEGKHSKRHSVRDGLKIGLGRLKQAIRPSSHSEGSIASSETGTLAQPSATSNKDKAPGTDHEQSGVKSKAWTGLETTLRALETSTKLFSPLKSALGELAACLDVIETAAQNRDDYEELASELRETIDILNQYASEFDAGEGRNNVTHIIQSIQVQIAHINKQREHSNTRRFLESANDREDVIKCYRAIEVLFRRLQNEITLRTWRNTSKQHMMSLLRGLSPVEDARYDSKYSMLVKRRGCTLETRVTIQEELQNWVRDSTAAKVYWMNGMAGTGKTTIAYSLCSWLEENMILGASFFCSRISSSCRDLSQIVPTIAYQLAHYSSAYRSALCTILEDDPDAGSRNVTRQLDKLLNEPLSKIENTIPETVVIVIDALDECQDQYGVRLMLDALLRLATSLPLKFFVTSRPEPSIRDKMLSPSGQFSSILHLHDIEQSIVEEDIKRFLVEALAPMIPSPSSDQIDCLAKQSGKLFIYAATAARYILPDGVYVDSFARLQAMLRVNAEPEVTNKHKKKYKELDMLYTTILSAALNDEVLEEDELTEMKDVLSTIICAKEPLSAPAIASLLELTKQQVLSMLQPFQSVVHVSEGGGSISALHASFPDYIFNQSRSGPFYCDPKAYNGRIAERCFDVMGRELRFNICQLESSYVLDRNVPDLEERINKSITPALLYACRYWGQHLQSGHGSNILHEKLLSLVTKKLLFWMEVLNLSGYIGTSQSLILCAQNWLLTANGSAELQKQISDARTFVTQFAGSACSQSTPHIYISALPFCLKFNAVYKNYWGRMQGLVEVDGTILRSREMAPLASWTTTSEVNSICLSVDGAQIACGFADFMVRVLNAHTGKMMAGPFEGHTAPVESVVFSPDATLIASGSADCTIRIWDTLTGKLACGPIKGHTDSVVSVAFSHNATRVISGSNDQTVRVWSTETGSIIAGPFQGHTDVLTSIAVSPNGSRIASSSYDCTIRVWDLSIANPSARSLEGHTGSVHSVAFSHDGSCLASGSSDHTIRIWDPHSGTLLAEMPNRHYGWIKSVAFSPVGNRVASGCDGGTIRVWDIDTKSAIAGPFRAHFGAISSLAFSPEGSRIVSGHHGNTICVWDAYIGGPVDAPEEHTELALLLAFSPEGSRLATASDEGSLFVRDANNGRLITGSLQAHAETPKSLVFSPDSAQIAAGFFDGVAYVFNAMTGEISIAPFEAHTYSINSIAFSPNGERFITGSSDCTARLWDAHTGNTTAEPLQGHIDAILSVQFSPDGVHIATGSSDNTVRIWDANTRLCKNQLLGHESGINSVAFSPDGALVGSGSDDTTIKLWKFHENDCTAETLRGHTNGVELVCFALDGTQIISSAFDRTILVQNIYTGDILARPLEGFTDAVRSITISPTGPRIASSSVEYFSEEYSIIRLSNLVVGYEVDAPLRGSWNFNEDGWIMVDGKLLLWIPPILHECVPYHHEALAIGAHGSLHIGWQNLALGEGWSECYRSE